MNHSFLKFTAFALLASAGVALSACTEEAADSTDIKTSGIHAVFAAVAKGDGKTVVTGDLHVASAAGTALELKGSDELLVKVAAESQALGGTNTKGRYQASFGTEAADTMIVVDFNRAAEDVSAPGSTVKLPAPFTLSLEGLSSGASIKRGTDVNLKMEPAGASGAKVNWTVSGSCLFDKSGSAGDDGTIMIPASSVDLTPSGEGKTCEVTVTVERVNGGTLASQFKEGGSVTAKQVRSVTFNSTPAAGEMMQTGSGGSSGTGGSTSTGGATNTGAGGANNAGANNGGAAGAR